MVSQLEILHPQLSEAPQIIYGLVTDHRSVDPVVRVILQVEVVDDEDEHPPEDEHLLVEVESLRHDE